MRALRRSTGVTALAVALVLAAAACGDDAGDSDGGEAAAGEAYAGPVGEPEGSLSVLAWPAYAEDGSTDPAVDWVTPFEEETGCEVEVKVFATSNEAFELFTSGGYDVVSASGDASLRLVAAEAVQPVNTDLVANYADINEGLKDQEWNTVDGVNYGVPHGRGANLLLYNLDAYPEPPDSWAEMWEADSPAAGKISPYDDTIYIADAAVYLMATQPDLGIENPYSLDQEQFDAAIALLEQQKPLVAEYWADFTKQANALASGSVVQSQGWQVTANVANADSETVGAVKPAEGSTGWSDTWMVASDTANINCSYLWLDHITSPEVQAQQSEYFGEAPANSKACELTENPDHCVIFHAEETDFWNDVWYWTTPTAQCIDGRTDVECVPYSEWVDAWTSLRSS
jgi:putative spermidine/putrescine transport system substrate-binding protein